ncbi:MAG: hypothetical protein CMB97_03225 [Flavobacteriaceae bacterium]|nr:hypothetical protein [Flavobacteriaceae bacterium]
MKVKINVSMCCSFDYEKCVCVVLLLVLSQKKKSVVLLIIVLLVKQKKIDYCSYDYCSFDYCSFDYCSFGETIDMKRNEVIPSILKNDFILKKIF